MKKTLIAAICLLCAFGAKAQDIVKTGLNFGPLPAIAYDADKGFQYGAILHVFDYDDGHNYPNYDSKLYLEASFFTKGSKLFTVMYDNKELIPGVRWSSAVVTSLDRAYDFYGFNGYESYYDYSKVADGKSGASFIYTPFYRIDRTSVLAKTDFTGKIFDNLYWEAGYHASFFKVGSINRESINKGKKEGQAYPDAMSTLYDDYVKWGLIGASEANGGFTSSVRFGLMYDSRDKEGAPSRGIWAETHFTAAPKWLGTKNEFFRYSATFRHYVPIISNDVLTFAYRLNYEGTVGNYAPFYVLPYITVMGENSDKEGFGGYRTVRGIMRSRVMGLDTFTYTAEMRWRFLKFQAFNQNIALGLSAFSDGSMVTKGRKISYSGSHSSDELDKIKALIQYKSLGSKETMHVTFGAGFRFIMNENFIVALEYGSPLTHWIKNSPRYNQDGNGAFYINIGYLF
jgi:hypothetical protein